METNKQVPCLDKTSCIVGSNLWLESFGSDSSMAFCMEILMVQVFGKRGYIASIMMGDKSVFTHRLKRTESV